MGLDHFHIVLTPEEKNVFKQLFEAADNTDLGVVTRERAVKFFKNSGLSPRTLGEIWGIADTEDRGLLTQVEFSVALRLIGHAQNGQHPRHELEQQPGPLPRFEGINVVYPSPPITASLPPLPVLPPQPSGPGGMTPVPPLMPQDVDKFSVVFEESGAVDGLLHGYLARDIFLRSKLPNETLHQIWNLADRKDRGALDCMEFVVAMHLITCCRNGSLPAPPQILPTSLCDAAAGRPPTHHDPDRRALGRGMVAPPPIPKQFSGPQAQRAQLPSSRKNLTPPVPQNVNATQHDLTGEGASVISRVNKQQLDAVFSIVDETGRRFINGEEAVPFFNKSNPPQGVLGKIWDLANTNNVGQLNRDQFAIATYLTVQEFYAVFSIFDKTGRGFITGEEAVPILRNSNLPEDVLEQIWDLADINKAGQLNRDEFAIAMYLIGQQCSNPMTLLPKALPLNFTPPVPQNANATQRDLTGGAAWAVSAVNKQRFDAFFSIIDKTGRGFINGKEAVPFFSNSNLPEDVLRQIWNLADINKAGQLNRDEFAIAMYLIAQQRSNPVIPLPKALPLNLVPLSVRQQRRLTAVLPNPFGLNPHAPLGESLVDPFPPSSSESRPSSYTKHRGSPLLDYDPGIRLPSPPGPPVHTRHHDLPPSDSTPTIRTFVPSPPGPPVSAKNSTIRMTVPGSPDLRGGSFSKGFSSSRPLATNSTIQTTAAGFAGTFLPQPAGQKSGVQVGDIPSRNISQSPSSPGTHNPRQTPTKNSSTPQGSDLIEHYRLETVFYSNSIKHIRERVDPANRWSKLRLEEMWFEERAIGEGGFSKVWLQRSQNGTDFRAVKIMKKSVTIDYERELLALAKLSKYKDYFVDFYGWYEDRKQVYLTMEYFELGDLGAYIYSRPTISESFARDIIFQVLEGLKIMLELKFTHRDLKPQNIFVYQTEPSIWVKIGDFGVSKRLIGSTVLRTQIFTKNYAAPEVFDLSYDDNGMSIAYTNAVDIWSLGVITHELLTKQVPFRGDFELLRYADGNLAFPMRELNAKGVSPAAVKFIRRLLVADPMHRPTVQDSMLDPWIAAGNPTKVAPEADYQQGEMVDVWGNLINQQSTEHLNSIHGQPTWQLTGQEYPQPTGSAVGDRPGGRTFYPQSTGSAVDDRPGGRTFYPQPTGSAVDDRPGDRTLYPSD